MEKKRRGEGFQCETRDGPWAGREALGRDVEVKDLIDRPYKGGGPALGELVGLVSFQSPAGNLRTSV